MIFFTIYLSDKMILIIAIHQLFFNCKIILTMFVRCAPVRNKEEEDGSPPLSTCFTMYYLNPCPPIFVDQRIYL